MCFICFVEGVWQQVLQCWRYDIIPGGLLARSDRLLVRASLVCWQAHLDAAPASVTGHGRVTSAGSRVFVYLQVT